VRHATFYDSVADFVLSLEVVIDISQRNLGFFCDISECGVAETVAVGHFGRGLNESRSRGFGLRHSASTPRLTFSQLTNLVEAFYIAAHARVKIIAEERGIKMKQTALVAS